MLKPTFKSNGVNRQERLLAAMAENSFLSLWSYPNVYTDEGYQKNKQGTELCDLLVVFGDSVILFSDKEVAFKAHGDPNVAWSRWYRRAIIGSHAQLIGALKSLKNDNLDFYLDSKCTNPFPFDLKKVKNFHLVATTNDISNHTSRYYEGSAHSNYTLPYFSVLPDPQSPFVLTDINDGKHFIHTFDGAALKLLFSELDTINDFLSYLISRHSLIRNQFGYVVAYNGEEELLSVFLNNRTYDERGESCVDLILDKVKKADAGAVSLEHGLWGDYLQSAERKSYESIRKYGAYFDIFLERISDAVIQGNVGLGQDAEIQSHEQVLRILASENRLCRIEIGRNFQDKLNSTPQNARSARALRSLTDSNLIYVFLLLPRDKGQSYKDYRDERSAYALMYANVISCEKGFSRVVVIATEPLLSDGRSEDVYGFEFPAPFTPEARRSIRKMREEMEIFTHNVAGSRSRVYMDSLSSASNKIPRNIKCPCGSGIKYKKCCYPKGKDELMRATKS